MTALLDWLSSAPQGAIAVITGLLAAVVAVIVAALTQWILGRRARTELLTKKLEELYLSLNEVSAHSVRRFEQCPRNSSSAYSQNSMTNEKSVEKQALDLHKKIVMLVRLYFPGLSKSHQEVFQRNSKVNALIFQAEQGTGVAEFLLVKHFGALRDSLVAMEEEIILNRRLLVADHRLPVRYKRVAIVTTAPPSR